MLGMLTHPGVLMTLIPLGVVLLGVITFELAMAITISTLPRSRFQQRWTPQEQRRVLRVFATVFCIWPMLATLIIAHVYLPLVFAVIADALVAVLVVLAFRWLAHGVKQKRLILAGHCAHCFYDLRASRDSNHCPECGVELHDHPARLRHKKKLASPSGRA